MKLSLVIYLVFKSGKFQKCHFVIFVFVIYLEYFETAFHR